MIFSKLALLLYTIVIPWIHPNGSVTFLNPFISQTSISVNGNPMLLNSMEVKTYTPSKAGYLIVESEYPILGYSSVEGAVFAGEAAKAQTFALTTTPDTAIIMVNPSLKECTVLLWMGEITVSAIIPASGAGLLISGQGFTKASGMLYITGSEKMVVQAARPRKGEAGYETVPVLAITPWE